MHASQSRIATGCLYLFLAISFLAISPVTARSQETRSGQRGRPAASEKSPEKTSADKQKKPVFSGPQKGEPLGSVPVWVLPAGDEASEKVDLREKSEQPLVIAFMQQKSRPAFALTRLMGAYATKMKKKKLQLYFVVLSDDRSGDEQWLRNARKHLGPDVGIGIAEGGAEGPGSLGLNRLVAMTVLVTKDGKVTDNFAMTQITDKVDGPKILAAMANTIDEKPPKLEELLPARRMRATRPQR